MGRDSLSGFIDAIGGRVTHSLFHSSRLSFVQSEQRGILFAEGMNVYAALLACPARGLNVLDSSVLHSFLVFPWLLNSITSV